MKSQVGRLNNSPKKIRPTGPGGSGRGHGRGSSRLPSQHITLPETMKYVQEAGQRSQR